MSRSRRTCDAAPHEAVEHVAARDRADLRDPEHLADLDHAERAFLLLGREHAGQRRLDLVDRFVNDVVVADVDAVVLGELARRRVGARVEADDHGLRREREVDVGLGDAADRRVHDVDPHLVGRQLGERMRQAFVRALHVGLDDQRQRLRLRLAHVLEHVLELRRLLLGELHVAELALAEQRDLARLALVAEHHHVLAGVRNVGQALDLDRNRRTGLGRSVLPFSSIIARTRPNTAPASTMSPRFSVPDCTSTVATGPRPLSRRDSMTMPLAGASLRRLELEHFGLQQDRFEQLVDALRRSSPTPGRTSMSPPHSSGIDALGDELLLDALGIRFGLVDLVHRDDDRHVARLRVRDRFVRLRHDAVVGRDHQHDDVGDLRAARAHRGERLVARRIEERDHALAASPRDTRRCAA